MNPADVTRIEEELGVIVPAPLREFWVSGRDEFDPDETSVMGDPEEIISMTREYRNGFGGHPPWPGGWVYLGDEADACPWVLDCSTGGILQLDKGNPNRTPLTGYPSFQAFRADLRSSHQTLSVADETSLGRRDRLGMYLPAMIVLVVIFVVLPLCFYSASLFFKWLFR